MLTTHTTLKIGERTVRQINIDLQKKVLNQILRDSIPTKCFREVSHEIFHLGSESQFY